MGLHVGRLITGGGGGALMRNLTKYVTPPNCRSFLYLLCTEQQQQETLLPYICIKKDLHDIEISNILLVKVTQK